MQAAVTNAMNEAHPHDDALLREGKPSPRPAPSGSGGQAGHGQGRAAEPSLSIPALPVVLACVLAPVVGVATWLGVTLGFGYSQTVVISGVVGSAVVLVVTLVSMLVTSPWTLRPVGLQMTMWMAGTVVRLLATPALAFLLYSAAPLDGKALALSVGAVHLVTLITEASVMSRLLGRAITPG